MYTLANNYLRVAISSKGAELKSIFDKVSGKELLWQADSAFWGKSSPVLFPIVGALKDNTYYFKGQSYQLSRHGFARDQDFEMERISDDELRFTLLSSKETKLVYPFDFKLIVTYTLFGDKLMVAYTVENISSTETMYFSLGAHPAFCVGTSSDEFSNYQIVFTKDDQLVINPLQDNLIQDQEKVLYLENKTLRLDYQLFEHDALVLKQLHSKSLGLVHQENGKLFDFEFDNLPYFGIWTVDQANFICLEPWAGVADFESHNQQLTDKVGITQLAPNDIWKASWSIKMNNS